MNGASAGAWLLPGLAVPAATGLAFALWFAADRLALPTRTVAASVVEKRHTPPGETYRTIVVGDQTFVQPQSTGETYAVVYDVDGELALGLHAEAEYEALAIGQRVELDTRRTRLTRRAVVVAVRR